MAVVLNDRFLCNLFHNFNNIKKMICFAIIYAYDLYVMHLNVTGRPSITDKETIFNDRPQETAYYEWW